MPDKILICSSEETTRETIKMILCDHYNLIITDDATQLLHTLANNTKNGIILIEAKMLKGIIKTLTSQYSHIKIIAIADHRAPKSKKDPHIYGYVARPFKADQILETIKKAL